MPCEGPGKNVVQIEMQKTVSVSLFTSMGFYRFDARFMAMTGIAPTNPDTNKDWNTSGEIKPLIQTIELCGRKRIKSYRLPVAA